MFSQVSVCPRSGVCPIAYWDTPPRERTPTQGADTPLEVDTPWEQTPPAADTPLRSACLFFYVIKIQTFGLGSG